MTSGGMDKSELIVKLVPAATVHGSVEHRALQAHLDSIGVALQPLHPASPDPELASYAVARPYR